MLCLKHRDQHWLPQAERCYCWRGWGGNLKHDKRRLLETIELLGRKQGTQESQGSWLHTTGRDGARERALIKYYCALSTVSHI